MTVNDKRILQYKPFFYHDLVTRDVRRVQNKKKHYFYGIFICNGQKKIKKNKVIPT